jgi:Protein of unknown function (DUF3761)
VGIRAAFFVALTLGAVGLGADSVVSVERPADVEAGCGSGYYQNSDGQCIPDPKSGVLAPGSLPVLVDAPGLVGSSGVGAGTPGGPPPGATAMCRDGDYSFSTHHSGTCSRHGGVREWLSQ